jgi:hypothetical protein
MSRDLSRMVDRGTDGVAVCQLRGLAENFVSSLDAAK